MKKTDISVVIAKAEELGGHYDGRGSWDMVTFVTKEGRDDFRWWLQQDGTWEWQDGNSVSADGEWWMRVR